METVARSDGVEVDLGTSNRAVRPALVSIVIPIYREREFLRESLTRLVDELTRSNIHYEIVLVEQFSDEETLDESLSVVAEHPSVRHILLPEPDFGMAMRHGMLDVDGDIIVNFDIDYWDVTFIRMCLAMMLPFDIDVVIGSKNTRLSADGRAFSRRLISRVFSFVLHMAFGLRVSDTHGIKAWHRSPRLIELIKTCRFTGDIFDTELVIRGERAGFRLFELPVTVTEQRKPRSSIARRIPGAVRRLIALYLLLLRDSSRRNVVQGRISDRAATADAVQHGV